MVAIPVVIYSQLTLGKINQGGLRVESYIDG